MAMDPRAFTVSGSAAGEVDRHADPRGYVESHFAFDLSDLPQLGPDFGACEDSESQVLVERTVPGDIGEGCQRDGRHAGLECPTLHLTDERTPDAEPLGGGGDADLLDVSVSIDQIGEDVADRAARSINGYPASPSHRIARQLLHRGRVAIRDRREAEVPKSLTGGSFDSPEGRAISRQCRTDHTGHRPSMPADGVPHRPEHRLVVGEHMSYVTLSYAVVSL
jgi:hypothetical protein